MAKKKTGKKKIAKKVSGKKAKAAKKAAPKKSLKKSSKKGSSESYHKGHWATTERELIAPLREDLQDAWQRIREFGASLGEQRIYASGKAIMFSKDVCYFFVRPKKSYLEVVFFLKRKIEHPGLKALPSSKTKWYHVFKLVHADQVEEPLTDWLREAFES